MRAGYIVLADRYVYTAYARDIVRSSSPTWVRKVYDFAIKPDATFYFRVPNDIAIERISVGRPKHRSFGNTFIFDPEELVGVGKAYNLTTKIQTKVLNVKEEYRKVFEDKRKDGKEPTYSCSSCDRITKSGQFAYITEDFTICSRCCEEDKAWKVLSEKAKLMSEGYSEEEALKKAIDEFGKDLPDMRDGEDLT